MAIKKYTREVDKKPGQGKGVKYSQKQKYEAVSMYKLLGSLYEVSKRTGINYYTLKYWHGEDWWKELDAEISHEAKTKRSKRLDKIVDRAAKVVEDRLENGEWRLTPSGEIKRVPIAARDANKIMTDGIDRMILIEKLQKEEVRVENEEKIDTRLSKLFQAFLEFSNAKTIDAPAAVLEDANELEGGDPEDSDAVHDEREAGLQEGEPVIQEQAGSNQETGDEEQGPPRCD